jgi:calcyphosin
VQDEFINAITKRSRDGQNVTEDEFVNYYADVNATLPHEKEDYFQDVVISTWGITSGIDYVSPETLA